MSDALLVPIVTIIDDGSIVIDWPDPRPSTVEISSDLFAYMVEEINRSRSSHV